MKLILASTSPYRRQLLESAGFQPTCLAPGVDEGVYKKQISEPEELAKTLARAKAESIWTSLSPKDQEVSLVLGGDQICRFNQEIFDKPGTSEKAIQTLEKLSGSSHQLLTAVHMISHHQTESILDVTTLQMRTLTRSEIEHYVAGDQPLNCAGSYRIESRGIRLMERIDSEDFTAIQGLPMTKIESAFRTLGFHFPL